MATSIEFLIKFFISWQKRGWMSAQNKCPKILSQRRILASMLINNTYLRPKSLISPFEWSNTSSKSYDIWQYDLDILVTVKKIDNQCLLKIGPIL